MEDGHTAGRNMLRPFFAVVAPPFVLLFIITACCCVAAGTGLMLFLVGVAMAMTLAPPLVLAHRRRVDQLLAAASVVDGVGAVWLAAVIRSDVTFGHWLAAYVLLAACTVAVTGLAIALARLAGSLPAASITILVALAWLAWPVWLSAWVDSPAVVRAMGWLIPVHPPLAMNGLLAHLGVWGELPLMYRLTSLGQDVPYTLPSSVALSAAAHFLLGGALLLASRGDSGAAIDEPDRDAR